LKPAHPRHELDAGQGAPCSLHESLRLGLADVLLGKPNLPLEVLRRNHIKVDNVEPSPHVEVPQRPEEAIPHRAGPGEIGSADVDGPRASAPVGQTQAVKIENQWIRRRYGMASPVVSFNAADVT